MQRQALQRVKAPTGSKEVASTEHTVGQKAKYSSYRGAGRRRGTARDFGREKRHHGKAGAMQEGGTNGGTGSKDWRQHGNRFSNPKEVLQRLGDQAHENERMGKDWRPTMKKWMKHGGEGQTLQIA